MKKFLSLFFGLLLHALASPQALAQTVPPPTWQEHWFDHNIRVDLVYYDDDVAIYYDADVDRNITWIFRFVGDVWRYAKRTYGEFGNGKRLYAIFHSDKYYGGHPSTWWDASHDFRNVIDIGKAGDWHEAAGWNIGVITHEISHIVELGSKQTHGSPAFGIWMDSKWAEIFNYDALLNIGQHGLAQEMYRDSMDNVDSFPRANTHWFRDWFHPIYANHGGSRVLNQYFELLARHFPKNGNSYARGMNWGEFVHFWSAAAGTDLKDLATRAFGWTAEWDGQLKRAREEFRFTPAVAPNPGPGPAPGPGPSPSGGSCKGTGEFASLPGIDKWCQDSCATGYCPATHCTCS